VLDTELALGGDALAIGKGPRGGYGHFPTGSWVHDIVAPASSGKTSGGGADFVVGDTGDGNGHRVGHPTVDHVHLVRGDHSGVRHGNGGKGVVHLHRNFRGILHKVHGALDGMVPWGPSG